MVLSWLCVVLGTLNILMYFKPESFGLEDRIIISLIVGVATLCSGMLTLGALL